MSVLQDLLITHHTVNKYNSTIHPITPANTIDHNDLQPQLRLASAT